MVCVWLAARGFMSIKTAAQPQKHGVAPHQTLSITSQKLRRTNTMHWTTNTYTHNTSHKHRACCAACPFMGTTNTVRITRRLIECAAPITLPQTQPTTPPCPQRSPCRFGQGYGLPAAGVPPTTAPIGPNQLGAAEGRETVQQHWPRA